MSRSATPVAAAPVPSHDELVDEKIVLAFFVASLVFLTVSMLAGILMALQLVHWNPLKGVELFSPGRWRMIHTNAIAYGFLANAFLGAINWAIPRMTFQPVASRSQAGAAVRRARVCQGQGDEGRVSRTRV